MKRLYVAWQDSEKRRWYPVGCLSTDGQVYRFAYTKGAEAAPGFTPFVRMTDLKGIYQSDELFPLFTNRLISKSRPEYENYLEWLNVEEKEDTSFMMLSMTEGARATDSLEVFSCPEPNSAGKYEVRFLNHGLRHLPEHSINRVNDLRPGEKLFLMHDLQNPSDQFALVLRSDDPATIVGYCPRYMTRDLHRLLEENPASVRVTVERVNPDAPSRFRLVCKVQADWPEGFQPCSDELYQPIAEGYSCSTAA